MENKIAVYRNSKKISQAELAKKVGISRPYLSNIENSKKEPSCNIALKIAIALNKKVEDIFLIKV